MDIKAKGRLAGLTIFFAAFVGANAFPSASPAIASADRAPVIRYSDGHARMTAAQASARQHLAQFLAHVLDEDGAASDGAAVKIAIPTAGGGQEVIWVSPFARRGETYLGILADEPKSIDGYHQGDLISFDSAQVRDWSFFGEDGRMYGSYTTRVIMAQLDPAQAERIQGLLSPTPLPSNW